VAPLSKKKCLQWPYVINCMHWHTYLFFLCGILSLF